MRQVNHTEHANLCMDGKVGIDRSAGGWADEPQRA